MLIALTLITLAPFNSFFVDTIKGFGGLWISGLAFNSFFVDTSDSLPRVNACDRGLSIHSLLIHTKANAAFEVYVSSLSIHSLLIHLLITDYLSCTKFAFNSFFVDT